MTMGKQDDYVNPTADGATVSWRSIQSMDGDFKVTLHEWKQGRHEISSRHCTIVMTIGWIGIKV